MTILAIDTSTAVKTAAVLTEDQKLTEYYSDDVKNHSESVLPMIDRLLKDRKLSVKDVDCIMIGKGPGSYTGLRIGAATVKGLAFGRNIPIIGVSTLEALSYNLLVRKGYIAPILDARRGEVYTALFYSNGKKLERKASEVCLKMEDWLFRLKKEYPEEEIAFLGDAVDKFASSIVEILGEKGYLAPVEQRGIRASSVLLSGKNHMEESVTASEYVPDYLKTPFINTKKE